MTYDEIKTAWDVQVDVSKQWDELGEDEKIELAFGLALKFNIEPVAWCVTGCSTVLDEYDAKAEAKRCGGSSKAVPLYTKK